MTSTYGKCQFMGYKPTLLKTGIKAYCEKDEVLILANRSSNPAKKGLILANSIGVIDSDYYGNEDNDGNIMYAFYNFFPFDITIKKGEVIGQAYFQNFLIADNDEELTIDATRRGGFGSTDNNKNEDENKENQNQAEENK